MNALTSLMCVWGMEEVEGEHGGCVSPGICEGGEGGSHTFCTRLLQLDIFFFPRLDLGSFSNLSKVLELVSEEELNLKPGSMLCNSSYF